jgi:hypothetical protein
MACSKSTLNGNNWDFKNLPESISSSKNVSQTQNEGSPRQTSGASHVKKKLGSIELIGKTFCAVPNYKFIDS